MDPRKIIAYAVVSIAAVPLAMAAIRLYCRAVLFIAGIVY